jgi:hypothetical protein
MFTLTTPINVVNSVANLRKWSVLDVWDNANATPPYLNVLVQAQAAALPYHQYTLIVFDSQASSVLGVNPSSTTYDDQLIVTQVSLSGTPYTTLAAIWEAGNYPGRNARLKAVELGLIAAGVIQAGALATGTQP